MKLRVLIIEDNLHLQELYQIAFESSGHEVHIAGDGAVGLEVAPELKPNVILLDLMMPNMDGFAALKELHATLGNNTTVFITSNLNDQQHITRALKSGAADFLKKADYTPHEVVVYVEQFLARQAK